MFEKGGFPRLDPERLFVSFSTDTLFTRNYLGDNGDGPYGIQEPEWFFASVRIRLIRKPDRLVPGGREYAGDDDGTGFGRFPKERFYS